MISLKLDSHIHTINSIHAYSTLEECIKAAKIKGIDCLTITDHFGPFFTNESVFQSYAGITNLSRVSKAFDDVNIIVGVEIDIVNKKGDLAYFDRYFSFDNDLSIGEKLCRQCEVIIASYHDFYEPLSYEENTEMIMNVIDNPFVHILGHLDRVPGDMNIKKIVSHARDKNKIIEINASTFYLKNESQKLENLIKLCMELETYVTIGSDAHIANEIGSFEEVISYLTKIKFPKKLIISNNETKFIQSINNINLN